MRRKIIAGILLFLFAFAMISNASAHGDSKHYEEMENVLFGSDKNTIMIDINKKKLVRHLEYAVSIALDQFNGFKSTLLIDLNNYGVPGLPPNLTDIGTADSINFTDTPNRHRGYTHRGWTYEYSQEYANANWPKRKQVMTETVKKVLNTKDPIIIDSFAAVLYYVHVLGDMQADSSRVERDQVIPLIESQGFIDIILYKPNKDIFTELYHYLSALFEGRVNRVYVSYYNRMMSKIKTLYGEARKDMRNNSDEIKMENDNNLTPEQLNKYACELLNVLSSNMPILLKYTIFNGVFY